MGSTSMQDEELSEYELLRLRNVEENQRMLRSLGLISDEPTRTPRKKGEQGKKRYSRSPVPPTRPKSLRIQERKEKCYSDDYDFTNFCKPRTKKNKPNGQSLVSKLKRTISDYMYAGRDNKLNSKGNSLKLNKSYSHLPIERVAFSGLFTALAIIYIFRNHDECCKVTAAITIFIGIISNLLIHVLFIIL